MTRRDFLAVSAALPLTAQNKEQRGKQILDEALQALGGSKFLNMKDRTETGRAYSFYRERLSGLSHARFYTRYLTRPEPPKPDFFGLRERQSYGKDKEESAVLITETDAWSIGYRGARPLPKDTEERLRLSRMRNIFYILRMRLGEPGMLVEHEGTEIADNQPVVAVNITDANNSSVKVWFHATTKLPVRQEYTRRVESSKDRFHELTRFAKYREVAGIQWPFQVTSERDGEKVYEMFAEAVTINNDLNDTRFTLPSNVKILKTV